MITFSISSGSPSIPVKVPSGAFLISMLCLNLVGVPMSITGGATVAAAVGEIPLTDSIMDLTKDLLLMLLRTSPLSSALGTT